MENSDRIISIDIMRGFLLIAVMALSCFAEFPSLGFLYELGNNDSEVIVFFNEIRFGDFAIPFFIFLIGLSYQVSFNHRLEKGKKNTYIHFIVKYLCYIGLGSIMVSFEYAFIRHRKDPFILQSILMYLFIILLMSALFLRKKHDFLIFIKKGVVSILLILALIDIALILIDQVHLFCGYSKSKLYSHWSILHLIGFTGLLVIPFLNLTVKNKRLSVIVLFILYTVIQTIPGFLHYFSVPVLGGCLSCFGWLILMLAAVTVVQITTSIPKISDCLIFVGLLLISILMCYIFTINTRAATSNYLLLSFSISSLVLYVINLLSYKKTPSGILVWWGRNPLLLLTIGLLLKAVLRMWQPTELTPKVFALIYCLAGFIIMNQIAKYCYKESRVIKL